MKLLNVSIWYFYSTIVRMGDFHPHQSNSLTSILILKYDFWVLCCTIVVVEVVNTARVVVLVLVSINSSSSS